jgi:hypothetical protein
VLVPIKGWVRTNKEKKNTTATHLPVHAYVSLVPFVLFLPWQLLLQPLIHLDQNQQALVLLMEVIRLLDHWMQVMFEM